MGRTVIEEGSGGEVTSGAKKTMQQLREERYGYARRREGFQLLRWQIIRRKGHDQLIYGHVHPYPSDEQELRVKPGDEEEYDRQLTEYYDKWDEKRRLLQYSVASRRQKQEMRRRMEEFVGEMTNELTSSGPIQGQSVYVWPTTRGDNFREKLEEEPQEDGSCSQATTVGGSTGAAVLGSADSGIKKDRQKHSMCGSGDSWRRIIRQVLDKDRWQRHRRVCFEHDSETKLESTENDSRSVVVI